jgi:hypothetical protein
MSWLPDLEDTLISVADFDEMGYTTIYGGGKVQIVKGDIFKDKCELVAVEKQANNRLYFFDEHENFNRKGVYFNPAINDPTKAYDHARVTTRSGGGVDVIRGITQIRPKSITNEHICKDQDLNGLIEDKNAEKIVLQMLKHEINNDNDSMINLLKNDTLARDIASKLHSIINQNVNKLEDVDGEIDKDETISDE